MTSEKMSASVKNCQITIELLLMKKFNKLQGLYPLWPKVGHFTFLEKDGHNGKLITGHKNLQF